MTPIRREIRNYRSIGLIEFAARRRVIEAAERGEADTWQAPIEWSSGNPVDSRATGARDIEDIGIEIRSGNVIVVIADAENIREAVFAVSPTGAGVQALRARPTRKRRELIHGVR